MKEEFPLDEEARAEASSCPGGWVYKIDGACAPNERVPPERIAGAWKVDDSGQIVGGFIPNPNYQPRHRLSKST